MYKSLLTGLTIGSLAFVGIAPASAATLTELPSTANGTDNSGIQAYACTDSAQLWLPVPMAENPISSVDLRYDSFRWTVFDETDYELGSESPSQSSPLMLPIRLVYDEPQTAGDTVTYTLSAKSWPNLPVEFDFTMTVMSDEFDGGGSGTLTDPYLIDTASEFNQMRCIRGAYWQMTDDIDLSDLGENPWVPIGMSNYDEVIWSGSIDGDGHTISGLVTGQVTQQFVGLFGAIRNSNFKDLTLINPRVQGAKKVGALVGEAQSSVHLENVSVQDAQVDVYYEEAGLGFGFVDYGFRSVNSDFSGSVNGHATAFPESPDTIVARGIEKIGGIAGFHSGDGGYIVNTVVESVINVGPEFNFEQIAATSSQNLDNDSRIQLIGGFFGDTDEDVIFEKAILQSRINVESFTSVEKIGGALGKNQFPMTSVDIQSEINITALKEGIEIIEVGGVVGYADDISLTRSRVHSEINIQNADGSNNQFDIDLAEGLYSVFEVGGAFGDTDDDSADLLNQVDTAIRIHGADQVMDVGGYIGFFNDDNGLTAGQVVVTGSIDVSAVTVSQVGGYLGDAQGSAVVNGFSAIAAVTLDIEAMSTENVGPFAGELQEPQRSLPVHHYFDSDLSTHANQDGYNFLPATTNQLQNRAFLSAAGFDLVNSWVLDGGYPELYPSVYSSGSGEGVGGGVDQPIEIGDTLVFVKGNRDFTSAGGLLELEGEGLRGVALSVNGQPLFVQIITDISGFVQVPAGLAVGSYTLIATANSGNQSLQDAFRIVGDGSNSSIKVWTKRIAGETQAKLYAKNIIGEGKVRFVLNGREIAWINAADNTDPKLRAAGGAHYLVRTVDLKIGKNVLEIYVEGIRERRVVYTR